MRRPTARTWIVALVVAAIAASGCSVIGGGNDGVTVRAEFERTFNLFPGSDVRIQGIEKGTVRELLVDEGDGGVTAVLQMDGDVVLPADVRAIIFTDSLLGERYVQLDPPYLGDGERFQDGDTIELDEECPDPQQDGAPAPCTAVPAEFDEVLDALNRFATGIETGDLPRLVDNLAEILDGNGENLGQTLEAARDALGVLRDNDEELLALARELSDLNEVLNTRTQQVGEVIEDFAELSGILADQRAPIDQALSGLARLTDETGRLLQANRDLLEEDVGTLTRVGRTAERNLDEVSRALLGAAELFRHAERVLERDRHEWLPLVNNTDDLTNFLLESLAGRLESLCRREGVPTDLCTQLSEALDGILPDQICLPGLISCTTEEGGLIHNDEELVPLDQALTDAMEETTATVPEDEPGKQQLEDLVGGLVEDLSGPLLGGGGQ